MKKLGKLSINPKNVIKNEELVNLRGGYINCPANQELYACYCNHPAIGVWDGCYYNQDSADDHAAENCDPVYGGVCEPGVTY